MSRAQWIEWARMILDSTPPGSPGNQAWFRGKVHETTGVWVGKASVSRYVTGETDVPSNEILATLEQLRHRCVARLEELNGWLSKEPH